MKKILLLIASAAILFSCSKDSVVEEISSTAKAEETSAETKAAKREFYVDAKLLWVGYNNEEPGFGVNISGPLDAPVGEFVEVTYLEMYNNTGAKCRVFYNRSDYNNVSFDGHKEFYQIGLWNIDYAYPGYMTDPLCNYLTDNSTYAYVNSMKVTVKTTAGISYDGTVSKGVNNTYRLETPLNVYNLSINTSNFYY